MDGGFAGLGQQGPGFGVVLGPSLVTFLGHLYRGFQRPVRIESNTGWALDMFIHAGNVDSAIADLFTGVRITS